MIFTHAFTRPEREVFGTRTYEKFHHPAGICYVTIRDDRLPERTR